MSKHLTPSPVRRRVVAASIGAMVVLIALMVVALDAKAGTSDEDNRTIAAAASAAAASSAEVASAEAESAADASASAAAVASAASASAAAASSAAAAAAATHSAEVNALTSLADGRSDTAISVAALNTSTGASYVWGSTGGMDTGSIVKLYILETLLLQQQDSGGLSASEQQTATAMIENSSNDAAETLFEDIGGRDALIAASAILGLVNTVPGPDDYWGLTETNASDYITLLKNLVAPTGSPLSASSQAYVLDLMRNVESDQRWGVGVTADAGSDFANKNGWLGVDEDDGLWLVNSTGVVTIDGQQVLMVVLTQHNADFDSGVDLVQSLAQALVPLVT